MAETKKSKKAIEDVDIAILNNDEIIDEEIEIKKSKPKKLEVKKEIKPEVKKIEIKTESVKETVKETVVEIVVPDKNFYQDFLKKNKDFEFYSKGILLFDSKISKDISVFSFYDEYFTVFEKPYNYQGIKIKLKK
jgi:hypothetical protein